MNRQQFELAMVAALGLIAAAAYGLLLWHLRGWL